MCLWCSCSSSRISLHCKFAWIYRFVIAFLCAECPLGRCIIHLNLSKPVFHSGQTCSRACPQLCGHPRVWASTIQVVLWNTGSGPQEPPCEVLKLPLLPCVFLIKLLLLAAIGARLCSKLLSSLDALVQPSRVLEKIYNAELAAPY